MSKFFRITGLFGALIATLALMSTTAQATNTVLKQGTVVSGEFRSLREQGMSTQQRRVTSYTVEKVESDVWIVEAPAQSGDGRRVVMRELSKLGFPTDPNWQKPAGDIVLQYTEGEFDFRKTIETVTIGPPESRPLLVNGVTEPIKIVRIAVRGKIAMKPYFRHESFPTFRYEQTFWYAPAVGIFVEWRYESAVPHNTREGSFGYVHREFVATKIDLPVGANPAALPAPVTTSAIALPEVAAKQ